MNHRQLQRIRACASFLQSLEFANTFAASHHLSRDLLLLIRALCVSRCSLDIPSPPVSITQVLGQPGQFLPALPVNLISAVVARAVQPLLLLRQFFLRRCRVRPIDVLVSVLVAQGLWLQIASGQANLINE